MSRTWTIILAVDALTFARTGNISLVAFTIFLLAETVFALASLKMLIFAHFVFESQNVSLQNIADGVPPFLNKVIIVVANIIGSLRLLLALTCRSTSGLVSQTFTVKLQTLCILALASHALLDTGLLVLDLLEKLILSKSHGHHPVSHDPDLLLVLLI
jgi:hypothetical protein